MDTFDVTFTLSDLASTPDLHLPPRRVCGIREDVFPEWPGWEIAQALAEEAPPESIAYGELLRRDVFMESATRLHQKYALWSKLGLNRLSADLGALLLGFATEQGPQRALRIFSEAVEDTGYCAQVGRAALLEAASELKPGQRRALRKELLLKRIFFYPWCSQESPASVLARLNRLDWELDLWCHASQAPTPSEAVALQDAVSRQGCSL